jgi:hypothetical protein
MRKRPRDFWGNLAGPPARWSSAIRPGDPNRRDYDGFIKLRLVHSEGRSYLIPDVLIAVGGLRYFLPSLFSPPVITFNVEPGKHRASFDLDVGAPRATRLARLRVKIKSEDRVLSYEDGAQLYQCTFEGPRRLASIATGQCRRDPTGDFLIRVYHHTTTTNAASIRTSGELWSSPWNLAGTRRLTNVAYCYFTSLPSIRSEQDLRLIAMASDEVIHFQTTSDGPRERVVPLRVYRGSTRDRTAAMPFDLTAASIAPAHLYFHPNVGLKPAYYEVVSPEIIRVGVVPSAKLLLSGTEISMHPANAKRFDYVVLGDAGTMNGLIAPYEEEETKEIAHLERLNIRMDLFTFWFEQRNTGQMTGRVVEVRELDPR